MDLGKFFNDVFARIDRQGLINLLLQTIFAIFMLVLFVTLGRLTRRTVRRLISRTSRNANLPTLLSNLVYVVLLTIGALVILSIYTGAGISTLLTVLGLLSLALSLSIQDVLKNFVSGVYLLLEQPFSIGDRIKVREVEGKVENIQIRTTTLHTDDGVLVYLPNNVVFSEVVTNRTAYRQRLTTIQVGIATEVLSFDELSDKIKSVMSGLDTSQVSTDPAPQLLINTISTTKIQARLEFWSPISAPTHTTSDVIMALSKALPEAEISSAIIALPPVV